MTAVGIVVGGALVWTGAARHRLLRRVLARCLAAIAILGFAHLLVVASDISGRAPWSAFGSIDAASATDAGMAFIIRILLAIAAWFVVFRAEVDAPDVYWTALGYVGIALLGTWAFAGHARSQRWPEIGVATDVIHHAGAAVWIGSLAIVGLVAMRTVDTEQLADIVRRLSRIAMIAVTIVVITGVVHSVRLVGNPTQLLSASHGTYLAVKVAIVAAMLGLAEVNRRRVRTLTQSDPPDAQTATVLRNVVLAEFAIGLIVLAVTSAMVVTPPAVSDASGATPHAPSAAIHYIV